MRRGRLMGIMGMLMAVAVVVALMMGCTASQCMTAQRTFATAEAGYQEALRSGETSRIDRYHWTLSAAEAMRAIWCSTQSDVAAVK